MRDALPLANEGGSRQNGYCGLCCRKPDSALKNSVLQAQHKKNAGERLPCSLNLFPIHDEPAKAGEESACVSGSEGHAHTEMEAHTRKASIPFPAKRRLRTAPGLMPRAAERQKHEGRAARPSREQQSGRESEEGLSLPSPRLPCRSWGFGGDYLPRKALVFPASSTGCGAAPACLSCLPLFPPFPHAPSSVPG